MKWMALLTTLLLAACSFNDPDDVAYRQVIVASPTHRVDFLGDSPSIDVTTTTIQYY